MKYKIEISYMTGDSFKSKDTTDILELDTMTYKVSVLSVSNE